MKTKNLKSLALNKKSIAIFNELTGGKQPTTNVTNVTCGSICENSALICDDK
ncbi:hypothetical protein H2O64_15545 [Kordia sp. YSTF-M3]|uniref:Natural product n=1 Tax=Kordia aestuariivivens TaxID=2759037 RepID=A0ABR7QC02_9FLAO|nr:hypothetical protein [Kordia aestuariivivens]MBC8756091.1 hypothetical protein [Kordia aestuariivivens]